MITVGIAVHNEEKTIEKVISLWQAEPVDEILIISSGSTDSTDRIVKTMSQKDTRIRLITEPEKKGKPAAINKILSIAKGSTIIMTDGDVFIYPGAASLLENHFRDEKIGIVAGRVVPLDSKGISGYWMKISCDILHEKRSNNIELDVTGNLYAVKKGIVQKIPENTTLDDAYVALGIAKKGYKVIYEPKAIVRVKGAKTVGDYITQKARTRVGWYQILNSEKKETRRSPGKELSYIGHALKYVRGPKSALAVTSYLLLNAAAWLLAWSFHF